MSKSNKVNVLFSIVKACVSYGMVATLVILISACAGTGSQSGQKQAQNEVALLRYAVRDPGRDKEYLSEVIVNKTQLVMREPGVKYDFIVFNRENQTIYSVSSEDKTIFVITPKPVTIKPPIPVEYDEVSQPSAAMPKIQNMPATHFRYNVNGKHCYDVVTLPEEFLPDVRKALMEYRTVLAGEHASGLKNTPKDVLDACDLSVNIFHATKHLQNGVPIREWDRTGKQRFMVDYKEKWRLDMEQFELPSDYKQFSIF